MKLQTPPGCRDLLSQDWQTKRALEERLLKVFKRSGFKPVSTPAIEYYQTYNRAFSALKDREMYKFFDSAQDILTLRMDVTVPAARLAASRLDLSRLPLRLCYSQDVWKVRKAYAGQKSEVTDCGVEMIGEGRDEEILVLALEAMEAIGTEDWLLELQDCRLFKQAAALVFDDSEKTEKLQDLIDRKSLVELEQFVNQQNLSPEAQAFFLNLPLLIGDEQVLDQAQALAFDPSLVEILDDLRSKARFLQALGYGRRISFDLGKLPHLNYYTGLIFEGFISGAGSSILSGGRYDNLMSSFGQDLPAVGFSIKLDDVIPMLEPEPVQEILEVVYPPQKMQEAFEMAGTLKQRDAVVLRLDENIEDIVLQKKEEESAWL